MSLCLIGLGSNLGDRRSNLDAAVKRFDSLKGVSVEAVSHWIGTEPIGGPEGQGGFLNGAAVLEASLEPEELLRRLRGIETDLGRERRIRWDARTLDVDILLFDDRIMESHELSIPHPRMICRRFVLEPAAEIASEWRHPILKWTVGQLFEHLDTTPPHFVLCGFERLGLRQLAEKIVARSGGKVLAPDLPAESHICSDHNAGATLESANQIKCFESAEEFADIAGWSPKLFIVPIRVGSVREQQAAVCLRDALIQLQIAPVLTITADDPRTVITESVAAIEAMR